MTKIKDFIHAEEQMEPFERIKRRAKRHEVKVNKATEQLVESMAEQNKKLSSQNLVLAKLYRACYRMLPENAQKEIDKLKNDLTAMDDLEVHP